MMKNNLLFTLALVFFMSQNVFAQGMDDQPVFEDHSVEEVVGYGIGDEVKDFKLLNVSGHYISLSDFKDVNGYIVVFTCNTCPYAVMYEERLIELHKRAIEKGYPVVAIMPNDVDVKPGDSFTEMQKLHADRGFPFVYLYDEGQKIYPQFGATKTPHVYLLDADRKVQYIGAIDDNARDAEAVTVRYVEDAIDALAAGKTPTPRTTKAIGCSIKVKK